MQRLLLLSALVCLICDPTPGQQPEQKPQEREAAASPSPSPSAQPNSRDILRTFRTIQVRTGTWLAKPEMCEGALQKHREFDAWELSIVRDAGAEVVIKIDHQPGWFYYQYSMVHSATGIVLASGNVTAWDGKVACEKVGDILIDRVKRVRPLPESDDKGKKKKEKT